MSLATRIAQEFNNVRSHISGITATHLLGGNLYVSNEVITNGFSTTLYTGNGGTQSINTGINMTTQWGDDVSETFGGLSWIKGRSDATSHQFVDTVRGATKAVISDTTGAETTDATRLNLFNNNGFTIGSNTGVNASTKLYTSWNFQTTHRRTGVTNHGKTYTEHYNPFTGFTIIKYAGSGIAGHEIPHALGRKLGIKITKNLTDIYDWYINTDIMSSEGGYLRFATESKATNSAFLNWNNDNNVTLADTSSASNASTKQYIMYGWANSYLDETNKLIGNYEIGVYQGTGIAGNKVITIGKPAWIMIKRLDVADNWLLFDNQRVSGITDGELFAHTSQAEVNGTDFISLNTNDFTINIGATGTGVNASGGQYLYMVVYDNDSGSGKSKYPKATDASNVQINNAIIPLAHGVDSNGSKNSIVVANETITGLTYTQGKNYLYKTDTGYGVKPYEPRYLSSELVRRFAGEQPDYFDVESNKWFNTDAGSELVSNGTFSSGVTTGWTIQNGSTISVVNGTLNIVRGTGNYAVLQVVTGLTIGKKYKFTIGIVNNITLFVSNTTNTYNYATISSSNTSVELIATETSLLIQGNVASGTGNIDNISIFTSEIILTTEITESRNYLNHIVHADQNGQVIYVEELPKIEYKNVIKANEYQGRNAISLSIAFDLTTTPITIKGEMIGVKALIRTNAGVADIYLSDSVIGTELKLDGITNGNQVRVLAITDYKITIETSNSSGTATSYTYTSINGVGNAKIL